MSKSILNEFGNCQMLTKCWDEKIPKNFRLNMSTSFYTFLFFPSPSIFHLLIKKRHQKVLPQTLKPLKSNPTFGNCSKNLNVIKNNKHLKMYIWDQHKWDLQVKDGGRKVRNKRREMSDTPIFFNDYGSKTKKEKWKVLRQKHIYCL